MINFMDEKYNFKKKVKEKYKNHIHICNFIHESFMYVKNWN